ncbi:MAG TPA: uracil-DNA glycosylase, partial [Deltaproteobacteria bacterium]|nr:uracil-DNA glycosylase [Deltaproteobacteria bacterium]
MPTPHPPEHTVRVRGDQDPRILDLLDAIEAEAISAALNVDVDAYAASGQPWATPVLLGSGSLDAPVGFFGRDPGRTEVELREPFVGRGGSIVRDALHRARHGRDAPNLHARVAVGQAFFWANTVPFKPIGNKAWSVRVKKRFVPHIR